METKVRYDAPRPDRLSAIRLLPLAPGWQWHQYNGGESGRWIENLADGELRCLDCGQVWNLSSKIDRKASAFGIIIRHNGLHRIKNSIEG